MSLLLCGFGGFVFSYLVRLVLVRPGTAGLKLWLAVLGSFGVAAALYAPKHPIDLGVYGLAGAGLSILVHRFAKLLRAAGDVCALWVVIKRPRR
jgi:hypothetical protein